jgi:glycosyltransferase involved in cell wall biosynthesis
VALKDVYDIYVFTSDTDHGVTEPYENIEPNTWLSSVIPGLHIYYSQKTTLSLKQIKDEIINIAPDYIYLNHMFSPHYVLYPLWLWWRGVINSKLVLCPRGALYNSALQIKPYKKKPFLTLVKLLGIQKKITFHATNDTEKNTIQLFFPGSKIVVANNLPNLNQPALQSIEKVPGKLLILFVARLHPIKNLLFLLQAIKKSKSSISLTIAGPAEDVAYWDKCQLMIKELPSNMNVTYLGPKENSEVMKLLQSHHLFVLPTTGENFGHSIFESFLCGRPVLISDQTPWQRLEDKKAGWEISLSHPELFSEKIEMAGSWDQNEFDVWCNGAWQTGNSFIKNPQLLTPYFTLFQ